MNIFEKVSKKALELGLNPFDIELKKQPYNGLEIIPLVKDKGKELQELKMYILGIEIENIAKEDKIIPKIAVNQIYYD